MRFRNGCAFATLLWKRFAPFRAFSNLLRLRLLLGCAPALRVSSLSAKSSPILVERADPPWKIAVLQRAGGLENHALFLLNCEKNATAWIATGTGLEESGRSFPASRIRGFSTHQDVSGSSTLALRLP
jgi:hypothetical protein